MLFFMKFKQLFSDSKPPVGFEKTSNARSKLRVIIHSIPGCSPIYPGVQSKPMKTKSNVYTVCTVTLFALFTETVIT